MIPVRMTLNRTAKPKWESTNGLLCQALSTRSVLPLEVLAPDTIGSIDIVSRHYDDVVIDLPVALTGWTGRR
jgi:hypothetical protein